MTDLPAAMAPAPADRPRRQVPWRRLVVENVVVVVAFVAVGAGSGWLWSRLWDAPTGAVVDGRQWYYLDFIQVSYVFSGTGLFAVVGVVAGLALGVLFGLVCRASELVTLVVVVAASVLGAYLAYRVGIAQSPVNPRLLALVLPTDTELPDHLTLSGPTPYVAWPLGALLGMSVTYLFTAGLSAGVAETRRVDLSKPADGDSRGQSLPG